MIPLLVASLLWTDCPDFTVDKSSFASPCFQAVSEASVDVCYEPHQLGGVRGQLSPSSGVGGEYIFALNEICLPPRAHLVSGPVATSATPALSKLGTND